MDKIGLHIIGAWHGALGRPRLVKLMDVSVEYVAAIRETIGPEALIIIRYWQPDQPLDQPRERAREFVTRYRDQMLAMKSTAGPNIAFEGYNEISDSGAEAYALFEVERLRLMHKLGLRTVVGCWSVGTPDIPTWKIYQPVLDGLAPGDFVGLHEYWADTTDISNHWLCGRWSLVSQLIEKPIVITECGRDMIGQRGAPGWRRTCDPDVFLSDLRAYNTLLEQFPNVIGATVFTTPGPGLTWFDFDPTPVWPQVISSYSNPQTYPGITATVTPPLSGQNLAQQRGPDPNVPYWHSDRHGYQPKWIIVHDTEGSTAGALAWWKSDNNPARSSAHYIVRNNGEIISVVPEKYAAHHAGLGAWLGIPSGSVGGTAIINLCSLGIELEYPPAPASPPWPATQLSAAVELVANLARKYDIPRGNILRHKDIDPFRRSDPRNFDWDVFVADVTKRMNATLL